MKNKEDSDTGMTDDQKKKAIELINDITAWANLDELIEEWKEEDDMEAPLSYALFIRQQAKDFIKELQGDYSTLCEIKNGRVEG